jgi:hypothetical protein
MQLRKFINEPLELVVSYWSVNSKKGNKDASKWQPEINKCGYAVRYIEIKHKFHLILINREEKLALKKMLNTCIVR